GLAPDVAVSSQEDRPHAPGAELPDDRVRPKLLANFQHQTLPAEKCRPSLRDDGPREQIARKRTGSDMRPLYPPKKGRDTSFPLAPPGVAPRPGHRHGVIKMVRANKLTASAGARPATEPCASGLVGRSTLAPTLLGHRGMSAPSRLLLVID